MNEVRLIKQCQNGNKIAFNELITFYYPFVFKFLIKLVCDSEITKDLVQDTFLKLIKNIDQFKIQGKASFSTYLITIARNTYIDYLRKNKELQEMDIDNLPDKISFETNYFQAENYHVILEKIEKLPFKIKSIN